MKKKRELIQWPGTDTTRPAELVSIRSDDVIQIGGPETLERFSVQIYVGGELLTPTSGCTCDTCELLRSIPPPAHTDEN